jgi:hypothetical protein
MRRWNDSCASGKVAQDTMEAGLVYLFRNHDEQTVKTGTVLVDVMSGLECPVEGLCSWSVL